MFPFMGATPPGRMGGGFTGQGMTGGGFGGQGGGIPPWLIQMLMQHQGGGGGVLPTQRPQIDWNNPKGILPQFGARLAAPFTDNSGLSALWSPQVGQTQTDPLSGWQTTVNRAQSPLGGLLGRILGRQ